MIREVRLSEVPIGESFTLLGRRFRKVTGCLSQPDSSKEYLLLLNEPTVVSEGREDLAIFGDPGL